MLASCLADPQETSGRQPKLQRSQGGMKQQQLGCANDEISGRRLVGLVMKA